MARLGEFRALPTADRVALVHAAVLVALARALLLTPGLPVRRVVRTVGAVARRLPVPGARPTPARVGWAVDVAGGVLPAGATCLPRALAARSLLARYGYAATVRIGVARDGTEGDTGAGLAAHAWVEREGTVLVGHLPDLDRFVPLPLEDL